MAHNIYKIALALALLLVFGSFAYSFSYTGAVTGSATVRFAYVDADGDGYGNPGRYIMTNRQPEGYVTNGLDCNDNNKYAHPGGIAVCEPGADNNCNGILDIEENKLACTR